MRDVVLLEKAAGIGGTWRENTYPGCACDVPTTLYSLSFAPSPDWSHTFAEQPEIFDYLNEGEDLVEDAIMRRVVPQRKAIAYPWKGYWSPADTVLIDEARDPAQG